jgi:hypothetical protein
LATRIHDSKASWDHGNEISTRFIKPWVIREDIMEHSSSISDQLEHLTEFETAEDGCIQKRYAELNDEGYRLDGLPDSSRQIIEETLGGRPTELIWPQMEGKTVEQRWLRDAESRPAWDRWITEVESHLDLSAWAEGKHGLSFSLPHLVAQRWQQTLAAFETASDKVSATHAFFAAYRATIQREAEFARASHTPVGAWRVLTSLGDFLDACGNAEAIVEHETTVEGLVRLNTYTRFR